MTPTKVDLSPMEARVLALGLRALATQRGALRKLNHSEWRAMLRVARKLDAAVERRRAAVNLHTGAWQAPEQEITT